MAIERLVKCSNCVYYNENRSRCEATPTESSYFDPIKGTVKFTQFLLPNPRVNNNTGKCSKHKTHTTILSSIKDLFNVNN